MPPVPSFEFSSMLWSFVFFLKMMRKCIMFISYLKWSSHSSHPQTFFLPQNCYFVIWVICIFLFCHFLISCHFNNSFKKWNEDLWGSQLSQYFYVMLSGLGLSSAWQVKPASVLHGKQTQVEAKSAGVYQGQGRIRVLSLMSVSKGREGGENQFFVFQP